MTEMTRNDRDRYTSRETILALLSDEETAKVSTAEAASHLAVGEEYLDLAHPERGVQRMTAETRLDVADSLPRGAVSDGTWSKIVSHLAH